MSMHARVGQATSPQGLLLLYFTALAAGAVLAGAQTTSLPPSRSMLPFQHDAEPTVAEAGGRSSSVVGRGEVAHASQPATGALDVSDQR
jgi:hypothetical protein